MGGCLLGGGEDSGRFAYVVSSNTSPRDVSGVALSKESNLGFSIDDKAISLNLNGSYNCSRV